MNNNPGTTASDSIKSPAKRRRNASNVWNYIDLATRKCKVENCSAKFTNNTSTTSLIYHVNNDHQIVVNDESLSISDSDDENPGSQIQKSQPSTSNNASSRRKYGAVEQTKRDAALLVIIVEILTKT